MELLVHNILFLRKCITTLSPSKFNSSKNIQKKSDESNQNSSSSKILTLSEKSSASHNNRPKNKLPESATPNIFALLGQKLASSRKRPTTSHNDSKAGIMKPLTVNVEVNQVVGSLSNMETPNMLCLGPVSESASSDNAQRSVQGRAHGLHPSVTSRMSEVEDQEMLIVETIEVEIGNEKINAKEGSMQVFIPPKLSKFFI